MKIIPIDEIVDHIKDDVRYDRLHVALNKMKTYIEDIKNDLEDNFYLDQVIILFSRLERVGKEKNAGIIDPRNVNIELNGIRIGILELLNSIKAYINSQKQFALIKQNQNDIADLKKILSNLNFEVAKETISRLGECWAEIYQFERDFQKINNEFVLHYLDKNQNEGLDIVSQMELEVNSIFPISELKDNDEMERIKMRRKQLKTLIENAYSDKHTISEREHENFLSKFKTLFEKFGLPDSILEKNRFWLHRNLYLTAREYHNCYLRFMFFFGKKDYQQSFTCLKNMDSEKASIEKIILDLNLNFGTDKSKSNAPNRA